MSYQDRYLVLEPAAENGHGRASIAAVLAYADAIRGQDRVLAEHLQAWAESLRAPEVVEPPSLPYERLSDVVVLEFFRMCPTDGQHVHDGWHWSGVDLQDLAGRLNVRVEDLRISAYRLVLLELFRWQGDSRDRGYVRMEDARGRLAP